MAEKHLQIKPLEVQKFIKANELKEISNPMFFSRSNMPTPDGLLSNEIFGISRDDRSEIYAYINLANETFMHPLGYKIWCKLDSNVKMCAYELDTFTLNEQTGKLERDPEGKTGIKYLKEIIKKVNFKRTDSMKRNIRTVFLEKYRDQLFMENFIVIPAGYRDVDTDKGNIGVGEINKMYNAIIRDCNALRDSDDYGLTLNGSLRGRIQDSIVAVYDFLAFGKDPITGIEAQASGLSRKLGLIRRAGMKKSFDWGSRLVICTQDLRKENLEDIQIDLDSIGLPLAAICANFYPYMIFHIRQWISNNFSDNDEILAWDPAKKKTSNVHTKDWREVFSDERIKEELDRFMHGASNRFIAIEAPISETAPRGTTAYLLFKGMHVTDQELARTLKDNSGVPEEGYSFPINERPLTWCDLIFRAAMEITGDKMTLVSRFPIDTYFNQFPSKIKVMSTIETEPMIIDGTYFKDYPKIRVEDIGKNTTDKFVDVAIPNNVRLDSFGADFDGDTVSSKAPYSIEANYELREAIDMKKHYITLGGVNMMTTAKECLQAIYNLTLVLPEDKDKLTSPVF